jgi:hypothetical protein
LVVGLCSKGRAMKKIPGLPYGTVYIEANIAVFLAWFLHFGTFGMNLCKHVDELMRWKELVRTVTL